MSVDIEMEKPTKNFPSIGSLDIDKMFYAPRDESPAVSTKVGAIIIPDNDLDIYLSSLEYITNDIPMKRINAEIIELQDEAPSRSNHFKDELADVLLTFLLAIATIAKQRFAVDKSLLIAAVIKELSTIQSQLVLSYIKKMNDRCAWIYSLAGRMNPEVMESYWSQAKQMDRCATDSERAIIRKSYRIYLSAMRRL